MTAAKHDVFQAIADPTRREVLHLLANNEYQKANAYNGNQQQGLTEPTIYVTQMVR